jgi:MFS family permease
MTAPGRLALLTGNRPFATVWAARTAWSLADFTTLTALALYVYEIQRSATQVGIAMAARVLPQALGPLAGALSDRTESRRLLLTCTVVRLIALGTILLLLPPFPMLVVLIALSGAATTLFTPTTKSAVPLLVDRDQLGRANAMLSLSHNFGFAAGPVLGAFLFQLAGSRAAFAPDVVLCAGLAVLLVMLPPIREVAGAERRSGRGLLAEAREGLAYVAHTPVARAVLIGVVLWICFAALDNVALVVLLRDELHSSPGAYGLANSAYGVAMILAPMLVVAARWSPPGSRLLLTGLACSGVGLLLTGTSGAVALAILAYAVAGAGNGFENIGCDTTVGEHVAPDKLGRVFGIVYAPIFIAEAATSLATGPLVEATSARVAFMIAGSGVLAVSVLLWAMLRSALRAGNTSTAPAPARSEDAP